jgi:hypothetical protein
VHFPLSKETFAKTRGFPNLFLYRPNSFLAMVSNCILLVPS